MSLITRVPTSCIKREGRDEGKGWMGNGTSTAQKEMMMKEGVREMQRDGEGTNVNKMKNAKERK